MAGQIPDDSFAGSLSDPGIDPFEIPEVEPEPTTPAGQARTSAKPVPGPISPDKKLPPENLYSRMRSNAINALGLNAPELTREQPNPAYSPRFAAAAQGLGNMIDPSQYGMTGELLGMVGGAMPGTMASEVPLKSIPVWGGAMIAKHGGMEEAPFREAMLKDFGPGIEPQLGDIYQKSKGIYESHIAKASLNELGEHHLPNLQSIVDQYNKGIEGQDWYLRTRPELERQFGPDSDLFINMLAATSPNATVPANMSLALKAYKAYKNGLTDFRAFSDNPAHPGFMKPVIDNLNKVINNQPISGQKIINFAKNLRGETEPVTVDRWMMRALGMPKAPLGPNTYKFADYWLSQVAHDMGVEPRQLQAAVWKTAREVGGQSAATGQPFEAMLAKKLAKDPDLGALLNRVRQSGAPQAAAAAGYAQGGHVIDGGWYGQNSPSPVRMQSGGITAFDVSPLDPSTDPDMNAFRQVPGVVKDYFKPQALTPERIVESFSSNQDPGSYVRSAGQGLADPIYSLMQAGTKLPGHTPQESSDWMKAIDEQREGYQQSLPGGREDWKHGFTRAFSGVTGLGKVLPELPEFGQGIANLMKTGALEGAIYGAFDPEEDAAPFTWREKAKQMGLGAVMGSFFHPAIHYVEKAANPIIADLTRAAGEQAASSQIERAERAAGLEAERMGEEVAAQPGFVAKTARQALHSLDDVVKPRHMIQQASQQAQRKLSDWQAQNNLDQTSDPSWQEYLKASGQGGYASGGEVLEGLRRRSLAALRRPR